MILRTMFTLLCGLAVAGCGGSSSDPATAGPGDGATGSGSGAAPPTCSITLTANNDAPVAGPATMIQVTASAADVPGALSYQWHVQRDGQPLAFMVQDAAGEVIAFAAPTPGVYDIQLDVTGALVVCPSAQHTINVEAMGAVSQVFRLRVVPPAQSSAPVLETIESIPGGATHDVGMVLVPSAMVSALDVQGPLGNLVAYVQLTPLDVGATVEAYSNATGTASVTLPIGQLFNALIVPMDPGVAPDLVSGWTPGDTFLLLNGVTISGTVRDPDGNPLAGAQVQATLGGVPSSLATTASNGSFTLNAVIRAGAMVELDVTPPAASGLPRLSATSADFALTMPLQVRYASNVARRSLAGVIVQRAGAPLASARVTVVGSADVVGAVGTVGPITGGGTVVASGEVALSAITDASGALPAMQVPAMALSAVVASPDGELAVVDLDTTTSAPATLDAPATQLVTTSVTDPTGAPVPGAVLDLIPSGALAKAAAPTLELIADATGQITAMLPAGGHYDLRFHDPAGRGALTEVTDRTPTTIATSIKLGPAIALEGTVLYGGSNPLGDAAVQLLCDMCSGLDHDLPLAEGTTDGAGRFMLAIPDPGTR